MFVDSKRSVVAMFGGSKCSEDSVAGRVWDEDFDFGVCV